MTGEQVFCKLRDIYTTWRPTWRTNRGLREKIWPERMEEIQGDINSLGYEDKRVLFTKLLEQMETTVQRDNPEMEESHPFRTSFSLIVDALVHDFWGIIKKLSESEASEEENRAERVKTLVDNLTIPEVRLICSQSPGKLNTSFEHFAKGLLLMRQAREAAGEEKEIEAKK